MIVWTRATQFDFESREYRTLVGRANVTPFQYPAWLSAVYSHLVGTNATKPLILVGRAAFSGSLIAIVPLLEKTKGGVRCIEYAYREVSDYACPIIDTSSVAQFATGPRLSNQFYEALGPFDRLTIEPVRQVDSAIWQMLLETPPTTLTFSSHAVRYEKPYTAWRDENLGRSRRSQLDRKKRRLAECGSLELRVLSAEETADALADAQRWRIGRFANDPLQCDAGFSFYREVARAGAQSGQCRTYQLRCDNIPLSLCLGLVAQTCYCFLVLACDYQQYGKFSPGLLTLDLAMADWASVGGGEFDYTIGDEPYKRVFRCNSTSMLKFVKTGRRGD